MIPTLKPASEKWFDSENVWLPAERENDLLYTGAIKRPSLYDQG